MNKFLIFTAFLSFSIASYSQNRALPKTPTSNISFERNRRKEPKYKANISEQNSSEQSNLNLTRNRNKQSIRFRQDSRLINIKLIKIESTYYALRVTT